MKNTLLSITAFFLLYSCTQTPSSTGNDTTHHPNAPTSDSVSFKTNTSQEDIALNTTQSATTATILQYITHELDTHKMQQIGENCVVLIFPTDQQITAEKERIGEENFYIVADDNGYYMSNLIDVLDQMKIKTITCEKRILQFIGSSKTYTIDLDKENQPILPYWHAILFQKEKVPQFIELVEPSPEEIAQYFQ